MDYKPSWEARREGERAFERTGDRYSAERKNPYDEYDGYDELRAHKDFDDGIRYAERREEERREEERQEERRAHERAMERRREEEYQYEQYLMEQEQEQQEEQKEEESHE